MKLALSSNFAVIGGSIAGLVCALALAHKGIESTIYEREKEGNEAGAGIQLSPNATRVLAQFGLLPALEKAGVSPQSLCFMDADKGKVLCCFSLQKASDQWGAPYLTIHRYDLYQILYQAVSQNPLITLRMGRPITSVSFNQKTGFILESLIDKQKATYQTRTLIVCDGVWSHLRACAPFHEQARFSGYIAWRATLSVQALEAQAAPFLARLPNPCCVNAWLRPDCHFVAYPILEGKAYNFVAVTKSSKNEKTWLQRGADKTPLQYAFQKTDEGLRALIHATNWTYWPLFEMPTHRFYGSVNQMSSLFFAGDSAHALLPFAAQGAAMAIEDAACLAEILSFCPNSPQRAQWLYHKLRAPRLEMVKNRGQFNKKIYHAQGFLAFARNQAFRWRRQQSFLADLNWLYQYDIKKESEKILTTS